MRLSDLLGKRVVDPAGRDFGACHDVRVEQRQPLGRRDALVVTGIVVGKGAVGSRLGYGFDTRGPWLLDQTIGRLARKARYVAWQDLDVYDDRIVITVATERLKQPPELDSAAERRS